jgi:hypothetical protein
VIQDIQKRFELPLLKGAAYSACLRTIIHLRIFGVSFDSLTQLWRLEKSVMRLLHADSTGSPTWFLDSCGATGRCSRRLLLGNFGARIAAVERLKASHRASLAGLDVLFAVIQPRAFRGEL